jgi:hypothetical protein
MTSACKPVAQDVDHFPPEASTNILAPNENQNKRSEGGKIKIEREYTLASASLRQSLQDMELTEISSLTGGQQLRHNHFDARGSGTTARVEAIGFSYYNTVALPCLLSYRRAKFGSFSRFLSVRR